MAFCSSVVKYGYEDCRFEQDVDENFHCSICYNVLKEPRMCRNNEHVFCLDCITEHLRVNSQTCPKCNEHLSVDTLRKARVINNFLSKLKINCDHASRGCPEFTCLEELKTHVVTCGYAPVLCSNAECGMEINKKDKVRHETEVCEDRRVKCHDCAQIQEDVETLKKSLLELDEKVEASNKRIEDNHVEMKQFVGKLDGKVEALKTSQDQNCDQIKQDQQQVKQEVQQVREEIEQVKQEVKYLKESHSKVNKDVDEVKVMMIQVLEKLNMLEQHNKVSSPTAGILDTPREDILVAGRWGNASKSTEIFSWEKNGWFEVSEMNEKHCYSSSFIYDDKLFVVGGWYSKTTETLNLIELPLKWLKYPGELPYISYVHQTVVYQQRIIHIGGYNYDQGRWSDMISELQLTSPCTMKKLCQMPEQRSCHGAEIFEDKVMILGGEDNQGHLNTVLEFDVNKNECKKMPPLPHSLSEMATVCWRDQVVVLGGRNEREKPLNDVFMYDCKTGKITALPSMLEERCGCCAVITGDTIVVMGGDNEKGESLRSVECFTMGGSAWKYLPAVNKDRYGAVAEVLPSTRKYV